MEQLGPQRMIPVVMEEGMRNSREWRGVLGAALGTLLYTDMSGIGEASREWEQKMDTLAGLVRGHCRAVPPSSLPAASSHMAVGTAGVDPAAAAAVATAEAERANAIVAEARRVDAAAAAAVAAAVRMWDGESGQCVATLQGHDNVVIAVSWSPDGRRIVSGSFDKSVRVWDGESGQCVATLQGHAGGVNAVAWSPDGRRIVSGSSDKSVCVWDGESGQCVATLQGPADCVMAVAWSPDGRCIVSGS